MQKRKGNKKLYELLVLMSILAVLFVLAARFLSASSVTVDQLNHGWSVSDGVNEYEDVDLQAFTIGKTRKGDVLTIRSTIPAVSYDSPTIMFRSSLSAVEVSVDGKETYSFGKEYYEKGQFVPKKYNIITLDDGSREHDVSISFTIAENNAFRKFTPVYIGTKRDLVREFFMYNRFSIFVGAFFIIYSCLLCSLGLFLILSKRSERSVFYSAAVSMLMGIYACAYNDVFCFVSDKDALFSILEYISLYLIPVSISVLLYSTHPEIATAKQRIIRAVNSVLPLALLILHGTGIMHFNRGMAFVQVIYIVEIAAILPSLVKGLQSEHQQKIESDTYIGIDADYYLIIGFIMMIALSLMEIVKYNLLRYGNNSVNGSVFIRINYFTLGMLLFVICLFIYYFLNGIDHMNAQTVKKQLEGLAYTDALTGLMNRARCTQHLVALEGDYALVSLDLDRLKFVNDTFGHLEGDRMIKTFAGILEESFAGASLIGRMGGDEFLVVFEDPKPGVYENCLSLLEQKMSDFNSQNDKFTLSASAGCAYSYEAPKGYDKIFVMLRNHNNPCTISNY